jgi:hypothetical protein
VVGGGFAARFRPRGTTPRRFAPCPLPRPFGPETGPKASRSRPSSRFTGVRRFATYPVQAARGGSVGSGAAAADRRSSSSRRMRHRATSYEAGRIGRHVVDYLIEGPCGGIIDRRGCLLRLQVLARRHPPDVDYRLPRRRRQFLPRLPSPPAPELVHPAFPVTNGRGLATRPRLLVAVGLQRPLLRGPELESHTRRCKTRCAC